MAGQHVLELGAESLELLDDEGNSVDDALVDSPPPSPPLERLGGARADFVAALGRRVAELGSLAQQLAADPGSERLRDELRRRIHALAAGARLLRFARLSERLCEGEAALLIAAERGAGDAQRDRAPCARSSS